TLRTPLLAKDDPVEAAQRLIDEASNAGVRAILLRDVPLDGAAADAFRQALARNRLAPTVLHSYSRAGLDATRGADAVLGDALAPKKLKELRRQRRRLAETGEIVFSVAKTPEQVAVAIETFLALEAS